MHGSLDLAKVRLGLRAENTLQALRLVLRVIIRVLVSRASILASNCRGQSRQIDTYVRLLLHCGLLD